MEIVLRTHIDSKFIKSIKKYHIFYLLIFIPIAVVFVFNYLPVLGVLMAFNEYDISKGFKGIFTSDFVGLKHFIRLFTSDSFYKVLWNTLIISIYKIVFTFPAPIIFALLLNELRQRHFKKIIQTISYLPYFLSAVIVYGIMLSLLSPSYGLVNMIIEKLGGNPIYFIADVKWFRSIIVIWDIWAQTGWTSIIYLAAISSINSELYDAAIVDGANKLRQMWHITLPGIIPIIVLMLVFRLGSIMEAGFEQVFLLYTPPVYSVADIIDTYVYRQGLVDGSYSFASAVGLFRSVVTTILILTANKISRMFDQIAIF